MILIIFGKMTNFGVTNKFIDFGMVTNFIEHFN